MGNWTKGPWEISKSICGNYPAIVHYFNPTHLMEICGDVHGYMYAPEKMGILEKNNQIANAQLISAAPDMAEALEILCQRMMVDEKGLGYAELSPLDVDKIFDALSKAKGE